MSGIRPSRVTKPSGANERSAGRGSPRLLSEERRDESKRPGTCGRCATSTVGDISATAAAHPQPPRRIRGR